MVESAMTDEEFDRLQCENQLLFLQQQPQWLQQQRELRLAQIPGQRRRQNVDGEKGSIYFEGFPPEIRHLIIGKMDWLTLCAFRLTCRWVSIFLDAEAMKNHHNRCAAEVWADESRFQALNDLFKNDQRNLSQRISDRLAKICSLADYLPCYRCLRWLPGAYVDGQATMFTPRMSMWSMDICGWNNKQTRLCVNCGVKEGLYKRGTVICRSRHICILCGTLAGPPPGNLHLSPLHDLNYENRKKEWISQGIPRRLAYYCNRCAYSDSVPPTYKHFLHDVWAGGVGKYEKGMKLGKERRAKKGELIRATKGIILTSNSKPAKDWMRYCPVVKRLNVCGCWKLESEDDFAPWTQGWIW